MIKNAPMAIFQCVVEIVLSSVKKKSIDTKFRVFRGIRAYETIETLNWKYFLIIYVVVCKLKQVRMQ